MKVYHYEPCDERLGRPMVFRPPPGRGPFDSNRAAIVGRGPRGWPNCFCLFPILFDTKICIRNIFSNHNPKGVIRQHLELRLRDSHQGEGIAK